MLKKTVSIYTKIIILTFIAVLLNACSVQKKLPTQALTIRCTDNSTITLEVELARTEEEQAQGFMNRKKIPEGTGMLFVYKKDQALRFWMKNTPHPLSIAYIDSKGVIKEIYDLNPYSLDPVVSNFAGRYALEVPQGWFEKNNISTNAKIDISNLK